MRKIIALVISCLIIMSGAATVYGTEYTDVKANNWAHEAVKAMSDRSIIKGYPNGSFLPNNTITYGEFIKMALIAGTGADVGNAKSGNWASNYYDKALELKYFTTHDIDKSQLKFEITRAHMALILSSILGDVKVENYDEIQKGIKDITFQTKYEYDITKAYATGILTGYTDNTFRPDKTLSRAESATVIYRLVDESKRELPVGEPEETTESAITYPTSGLLDMSKLTPDKTIAASVHFTDEYELYTDASVWDIRMYKEWDGSLGAFDHTLSGFIYLVKDGEILEYCNTLPKYGENGDYLNYQRSAFHFDISTADYIISVPTKEHFNEVGVQIKAVINPFKQ